jgi:hypothetical protein
MRFFNDGRLREMTPTYRVIAFVILLFTTAGHPRASNAANEPQPSPVDFFKFDAPQYEAVQRIAAATQLAPTDAAFLVNYAESTAFALDESRAPVLRGALARVQREASSPDERSSAAFWNALIEGREGCLTQLPEGADGFL